MNINYKIFIKKFLLFMKGPLRNRALTKLTLKIYNPKQDFPSEEIEIKFIILKKYFVKYSKTFFEDSIDTSLDEEEKKLINFIFENKSYDHINKNLNIDSKCIQEFLEGFFKSLNFLEQLEKVKDLGILREINTIIMLMYYWHVADSQIGKKYFPMMNDKIKKIILFRLEYVLPQLEAVEIE